MKPKKNNFVLSSNTRKLSASEASNVLRESITKFIAIIKKTNKLQEKRDLLNKAILELETLIKECESRHYVLRSAYDFTHALQSAQSKIETSEYFIKSYEEKLKKAIEDVNQEYVDMYEYSYWDTHVGKGRPYLDVFDKSFGSSKQEVAKLMEMIENHEKIIREQKNDVNIANREFKEFKEKMNKYGYYPPSLSYEENTQEYAEVENLKNFAKNWIKAFKKMIPEKTFSEKNFPTFRKIFGMKEGKNMKLNKPQLQKLLVEQVLFSEGLRYHVEKGIPLYDCIYRPGSKGFFSLISESRMMYNNGLLKVDENELDMLNSDLGEFALYEGRKVALDFPISEEADYELRKQYLEEGLFSWLTGTPNLSPEQKREKEFLDFHKISVENPNARMSYLSRLFRDPRQQKEWLDEYNKIWKPKHIRKLLEKKIKKIQQRKLISRMELENDEMIYYLNDLINQLEQAKLSSDLRAIDRIEKEITRLGSMLEEGRKKRKRRKKRKKTKAKKSGSHYKGRKVKLNKPQRNSGSGGKFVVYVRNKKTGNVKRITFGARGMTTGLRNPARRKSFAARHRCAQKKDKLAPGYWACRIGRYPAVSGAPYTTWW